MQQISIAPSSVMHSRLGDIFRDISEYDREVTLVPGEYIDLEYSSIPSIPGNKNAFLLNSYGRYTKDGDEGEPDGGGFSFDQNYPNPFNPATTFSFALPADMHVNITIYNILGQNVCTVVDKRMPAGQHSVVWDGKNNNGKTSASGVYFAKFTAGEYIATRKMTIIK